jgi:hypothetical protein
MRQPDDTIRRFREGGEITFRVYFDRHPHPPRRGKAPFSPRRHEGHEEIEMRQRR